MMKPTVAGLLLAITCVSGVAVAADTGQLPCATTAECNR
jgi:hypothetical protein